MDWETLPTWVWIIYYLFLLTTFGAALYSIIRKKLVKLSFLAFVLTFIVPIISLINSIERTKGMNELEHLLFHLQQGSIWAIYTLIGFIYFLVWWILFLFQKSMKAKGI